MAQTDTEKSRSGNPQRVWPWALAGAFFYGLGLTPTPPEVRMPLNLLGACALTIAAARWYQKRRAGSRKRLVAWAVLVALSPTWLLAHALAAAWLLPLYDMLPKWFWLVCLAGYGGSALLVWRVAQTPPEGLKKLALGLTVSLVTVALTCGVLELGLRALNKKPANKLAQQQVAGVSGLLPVLGKWAWLLTGRTSVISAHVKEFYSQYPSDPRGYFEPGQRITYRNNAAGFRDDEFNREKRPGTLRVALLGDSLAFGLGVKKEDLAAVRLESLLSGKMGCPVEIYNFSASGFNTKDEADLLEATVWGYQPDAIIVWYSMTDLETVTDTRRGAVVANTPWLPPFVWQHSILAGKLQERLLQATYERFNKITGSYYDPQGLNWIAWREDLRRITASAKAHQTPLLLFVHPEMGQTDNYQRNREKQQVLNAAQELGVTAYDLLPAFAGYTGEALIVHPTDHHPNEIAHRLAAEYAVDKIAAALPPCPR